MEVVYCEAPRLAPAGLPSDEFASGYAQQLGGFGLGEAFAAAPQPYPFVRSGLEGG